MGPIGAIQGGIGLANQERPLRLLCGTPFEAWYDIAKAHRYSSEFELVRVMAVCLCDSVREHGEGLAAS
jgi:hypothetical protein